MKRSLLIVAGCLCAYLLLMNTQAVAGFAFPVVPAPVGQRLARADATVVGTVTSIEEKTVSASEYPGVKEKVEYFVATVKVDEALSGAKGLTHIKVAYLAPQQGRPVRPLPGQTPPTLIKGQEAILFLKEHHAENFYIMRHFDDLIDKKAGDYKTALGDVKTAVKMLDDPKKVLKGDNKDERFAVAAMLLARYRTQPVTTKPETLKQEEIDAEESKLILAALSDANWKAPVRGFQPGFSTPVNCFNGLGITEKDGWKFTGGNYNDAAQKWLKDNGDKFRIKKYVVAEKK